MTVTDAATPGSLRVTAARLRDWVRPSEGQVLGRVYIDHDLFALEVERIWKRLWLFAGHESEVPETGDYVTRTVGTVPLIIARTTDGEIAVMVNKCVHRGNLVCNHEGGNASYFKCAYHGWSYSNDGGLLGVPYQGAYGDAFDKSSLGLSSPARVAQYRGFIFVSHSAEGPTIEEHLGNARGVLDRCIDLSPTGRLRLDAGYNRVRVDANWKMYVENASDNYHANFVHISAFLSEQQRKISAAISGDASRAVVRALGNGHSELDFRGEQMAQGIVLRSGTASALDLEIERQFVADLSARVGEERAEALLSDGPPTLYVFPNMFIIQQDVRRLEPVSESCSHLYQHPSLLDGVPVQINEQRLVRHQAAYGPAGMVMSDDLEVFGNTQRALASMPDEWLMLSRGLHREHHAADGSVYSHVTDETAMRGMWRRYLELMCGDEA